MDSPLRRLARVVRDMSHGQRRLFELRTELRPQRTLPPAMTLAELEALWRL
jgi:hypothetical protein